MTPTAGAVGDGKLFIGGQLYDGALSGVAQVVNTGRPAAAQYAAKAGGQVIVRSSGGGTTTGGSSTDVTALSLLTVVAESALTNDRYLDVATGLTKTDGGAGAALTLGLNTPGTLTVSSTNVATGNHTHAITSSSAPGAAASLLASSAAGLLTLPNFTATTAMTTPLLTATTKVTTSLIDTSSGDLTISPAGSDVFVNGNIAAQRSTTAVIATYTAHDTASTGPRFAFYRAGNVLGAETATVSGMMLGSLSYRGHTGSAYMTGGAADVRGYASENFTTTANGANLRFYTTTSGTNSIAERMRIHNSGNVSILNTTDNGFALDVTGTARITTSLTTPLLTTANNVDLVINPAGTGAVQFPNDQTLRTTSFDSSFPINGWQINEVAGVSGYSALTIGKIQADELAVRVFVADEVRVDRGDEFWTKSYGIVATTFTTPSSIGGTVSVKFEDSPALAGAIFVNNDWVLIRKLDIDAGITLSNIWGQVATYVNNSDGTQNWTFTLRSGPTSESVTKGSLAIDFGASGAALIHLSVIDAAGAPYIKMRKWAGSNPYTPANFTTYVQLGHLGSTGNAYVTPAGFGLYARSTNDESRFILSDDNGLQIRGASLKMYNSSLQTVDISATDGSVKLGTNIAGSSTTGFEFNGTTGAVTIGNASYAGTVTVYGSITVTGGNAAKTDFSNITATIDDVPNGTTYARTTPNQVTGAGRAYTALSSGNNLVTSVIPATAIGNPGVAGLYLGADYMGYHTGSGTSAGWKTYMDSFGNFKFAGSSATNYIQWAAASDKLQGVGGGTEQWYADATDGKLYAGAGAVWLDANGANFNVQAAGATPSYLRFASGATLRGGIGFIYTAGPTPDPTDGMVFYNASSTKFRFTGADSTEFSSTVNVTGSVTATVGMSVGGTAVSLNGHTHSYLPLSGGTLTGTLTSRAIAPSADNTYDLGASGARWQDLYAVNLHVDTIVGTPSYSHSHAAGDITSGTLDFARIPTTWTGALTLDADSAGTSNYIRWLTQTGTSKAWDLVGRAHDYATTAQQNDLLLTYYDGSTTYVAFQADSATRVIDFGQTPTVSGTAVSLTGHTHDDRYFTESESDARYVQTATLTSYLLVDGTRAGATSQAQAFNLGVIAIAPDAATSQLTLRSTRAAIVTDNVIGGIDFQSNDTNLSAPGTVAASIKALASATHTASQLRTDIVFYTTTGTTYGESLRIGGAGTITALAATTVKLNSTTALDIENASGTSVFTVNTTTPGATVAGTLSVTGTLTGAAAAFSGTVTTPTVSTASGNLSLTSTGGTVAVTGALTGSGTAAFTTSISAPSLITASGTLTIAPANSTTAVTGAVSISGQLTVAAGSAGAPSIAATSDTNTGLYWSAADTLAIATGGTQRATVDSVGFNLVSGKINATAIDQSHILDTALVGTIPGASNWAGFAHKNHGTLTGFSLIHTSSGETLLNGATTASHYIGGAEVWQTNASGLQSPAYASQTTGWRISSPSGGADFRYIYTDEMHAKAFIADLEQALAGGQIIAKSVTLLHEDFRTPYFGGKQRIVVKDLPSAPGMQVFEANDYIALRSFSRAAGELLIGYAWGTVTSPTDNADGTQTWTFNRSGTSTYSTITQRGTATSAATAAGTSVAPTKPTGVTTDDVLVAIVTHDGAADTITATNWELLGTASGTDINAAIYYKVADGAEPASYTFSTTSSHALAASVVAYYNVDTTYTPIDSYSIQANAAGASMTAPVVWTSSTAGELVFLGGVSNNTSSTAPSGMTEIIDAGATGIRVYAAKQTLAASGTAGPKTATIASSSYASIGALIMLRPKITVFYDAEGGGIVPGTVVGKDAIIVDYGTTGNGYYEVNAADGLNAENSPYSQIVTWATHPGPAGNRSIRSRWGNLNGLSIADYGLLMGSNVSSSTTRTFDFRASTGNLTLGANGGAIVLEGDGDSYFSGVMTIGTSGGIYQGSGTFASPTTGLKIWNDTGTGRIGGYNTGTLQWYANTDGKLYAGAGSVWLDSDGISAIGDGVFRLWQDGSTPKGTIYSSNPLDSLILNSTGVGIKTSGGATTEGISLRANTSGGKTSEIAINAASTGSITALVYTGSTSTSGQMQLSATDFTLKLNGTSTTDFSVSGSGDTYVGGYLGVGVTAARILDVGDRIRLRGGTDTAGIWLSTSGGTERAFMGLNSDGATPIWGVYNNGNWRLLINHDGNVAIGTSTSFGGGGNVVFIANATTVPSSNPTGGGILYVEGGALKFRGSSGTVTTVAAA